MADNLTSLSLLTLAQVHRGDVVRQINRSVQLLKMIPIVQGSGKNVAWPVEKDGALAEAYSEGADAVNFGGDVQAQAILTWGLYRANPHATSLALDAAASSYDPDGNKSFWARTIVNHSAALAEKINGECFTGAGTTGLICGLDEAICKDDNIYAGINRVTGGNEYWKPTVVDPGAPTAPTFALLRDDVRVIYTACGRNPDLAVCSPAVFNKIGSLFDATRRNIEVVNTARGGVKLDMGFQALELDGMFFIKERQATASRIYYLQTDLMELCVLPSADQRMLMSVGALDVSANDGFGPVPMSFHYEMLAKTGASEKAQILSNSQLVVRRPNAFGCRKNVSTT
jgi:hypothetical protein